MIKSILLLIPLLLLATSCFYLPPPPPTHHSEPTPCAQSIYLSNAPPDSISIIENTCLLFQRRTGQELEPNLLANLSIYFLEEEEDWRYCKPVALRFNRQDKMIRGCANRNRIELKKGERWEHVLSHEIIHIILFRKYQIQGNDTHHDWMRDHDLCLGFCGSIQSS